jgi:CheY-like chemotaxis protein
MPEEPNLPAPSESTGAATKPDVDASATALISNRLISDVWSSLVTLLVGLAWPATLLILIYMAVQHTNMNAIQTFVSSLMRDKQSVEISAGKDGLTFKLVAQQVQHGLSQQLSTKPGEANTAAQRGPTSPEVKNATSRLMSQNLQPPEARMKVLWVDDHPQNNIGLQYAFQTLGMIVVCIDSDAGISASFATAGRFDVVITDIARDGDGTRATDRTAGLKTIDTIKSSYPNTSIIIYSGSFAAQHPNDTLAPPVIAITNDPQKVFDLVIDIASKKIS